MIKKILNLMVCFSFLLSAIMLPTAVSADTADTSANFWGDSEQDTIALGTKDPREVLANVINVILGFLGIVAVIIILLGGFKWMTAAGAEDKVDEARKLITAGIVGLVIVMSAFGIATFVINSLVSAT